jgi:hypothetical protein
MDFEKLKKQFVGDPEVILSTEEFLRRVKVGDMIFTITSCCFEPDGFETLVMKETPIIDEKFGWWRAKFSNNFEEYRRYRYLDDFFCNCKCICITKEKAEEVLNILKKEFKRNLDWQKMNS